MSARTAMWSTMNSRTSCSSTPTLSDLIHTYICGCEYFKISIQPDYWGSFAAFELDVLAAVDEIAFEVVGVGPAGVGEIGLVAVLDLLQLLLLLVVHRHHLDLCLFVDACLAGWSPRASLCQLHDDLGFLVLACVVVEQLLRVELLASPPKS